MALTDDDVREILRIIDESAVSELRIATDGFDLHVRRDPGPAGDGPAAPTAPAAAADGRPAITAPMLGTFFRAESPGAAPFVEVGDRVEPDTVVGIVEVMKMMNSVPARVSGTIAEICADNAQLVEFGQPLFRVEPA